MPTAKLSDAQPIQQTGKANLSDIDTSQGTAPEPPQGNALQRAFDNLTTVTPEQEQGHSAPVNALQHVGAGFMQLASPLVHPLNAMEKAGDTLMHPHDTLNETIQGVKEHPWETVGNVLGGAALGGVAGEVGPKVMEKIPTRAKAGAIFNDLGTKLANQPVNLTQSTAPMDQLEKIGSAGPGVPTTVGKLLDRSRMIYPMNYPEARLFQENLSSPSTTEKMGNGGQHEKVAKQLNRAFYGDIRNAADAQGLGEDYDKGMRMYRQAATMSDAAKKVGKAAAYGAAGAAGAGAAYRLAKDLIQ